MKSCSAAVVGAITRAARESRNSRSTDGLLAERRAAAGLERQVRRVRGRLAGRRLHLKDEEHARRPARSPRR